MVTERGEDQRGNIPCKVSDKSAETGLFLFFSQFIHLTNQDNVIMMGRMKR